VSLLEYVTGFHARQTPAAMAFSVSTVGVFGVSWQLARHNVITRLDSRIDTLAMRNLQLRKDSRLDILPLCPLGEIRGEPEQQFNDGQCGSDGHADLLAGKKNVKTADKMPTTEVWISGVAS